MPTVLSDRSANPVFRAEVSGPTDLASVLTKALANGYTISVLDTENDPRLLVYALSDLSGNGYTDSADARSAISQPNDSVVPADYSDTNNNAKIWALLHYIDLSGAYGGYGSITLPESGQVRAALTSQANVLSVAAASTSFTVPSGFRNLRLAIRARGSATADAISIRLTFNADSGANYDLDQTVGSSGAVSATRVTGATYLQISDIPAASATANYGGGVVIWVPGYNNTTFYKDVIAQSSFRYSGAITTELTGGVWKNTAAITSVTLTASTGNFIAGSVFTLIAE